MSRSYIWTRASRKRQGPFSLTILTPSTNYLRELMLKTTDRFSIDNNLWKIIINIAHPKNGSIKYCLMRFNLAPVSIQLLCMSTAQICLPRKKTFKRRVTFTKDTLMQQAKYAYISSESGRCKIEKNAEEGLRSNSCKK